MRARRRRAYWPQWLETFCQQTGATPESAYVIPYDRRAAEELRLKFYWIEGLGAGGQEPGARDEGPGAREEGPGARDQGLKIQISESPNLQIPKSLNPQITKSHPPPRESDLRADLALLRFDTIKIRTFRGAVRRVLDPQRGRTGLLGFDPPGGRRILGGGQGAFGHGDGPRRLALAAGRRAGR